MLLTTTIDIGDVDCTDEGMKDTDIYWEEFGMVTADNLQENQESSGVGVHVVMIQFLCTHDISYNNSIQCCKTLIPF